MNRFTNHEHIITRASGELWHFTYRNNSIFHRVRSDNSWTEDRKLLEDVTGEFSADIDVSDNIHLVCINSKGELLYLMNNGEQWYSKQLATFPVSRYRISHILISCWKKFINVLYAISPVNNPSMWSIQHSFWNGSKWESFKVVRITGDNNFNRFFCGYDHTGSIHLVYRAPRLGVYQLYYCRFRPDYLIWGNPEKITTVDAGGGFPHILSDGKDTLHLTWAHPLKNECRLKYLNRARISYPRSVWRNESVILDRCSIGTQPLLYLIGDMLWIIWNDKGTLYGCFSYDDSSNWTSPIRISIPPDANLKLINMASNTKNKMNIEADLVFAYEKNGEIFIPVIDEAHTRQMQERIPVKKDETNTDDSKIREYTMETKNYMGNLMEEICRIENKKKEIETIISNQANEMAKTYDELETMKKDLAIFKERLDYLKEESSGITADINKWQKKYEEYDKIINELSEKHAVLEANVESLSSRSIIQRILDYFR